MLSGLGDTQLIEDVPWRGEAVVVAPVVEMEASVRVRGTGTQICGKGSFVFDSSGWNLLER